MKKTVSFCLAVIMLISTLLTANAVQTKKEASENDNNYSTFYFLAPRTEETNYFALNDNIGYYYWLGLPNDVLWPGYEAEKAPEIGKDVYRATVPEEVSTLIFNAFVYAGEEYEDDYDAEKEQFAFQTQEITDIEVWEGNDHRNEIYVLDLSTTGEVRPHTSGGWFSTDPESDNYYRLSDWYKAYNIENDTDTSDSPNPNNKKYKAGDTVTVTYNIHDISNFGAVNSVIAYNADILEADDDAFLDKRGNSKWYEEGSIEPNLAINNTKDGIKIGVVTTIPEYGSDFSDETVLVTVQFKAKSDFDEEDLGISLVTKRFTEVADNSTVDITDSAYSHISISVYLPEIADTNTDTHITTDTDTEKDITTDTNTDITDDPDISTDTAAAETDSDKTDTDTDTKDSDSDPVTPQPSEPIKKLKVGDVDDDGNISSADALLVLRYSVKLENFTDSQIESADVNKDGDINSADALFILRKSVKLTDNGTFFDD